MKIKGFTLLELLISITILSLVTLSLTAAFQNGIKFYDYMGSTFSLYQASRITIESLERDIRNSFSYLKTDPKFKGEKESLEFFSIIEDPVSDGKARPNIGFIKYSMNDGVLKRASSLGLAAIEEDTESLDEKVFFLVKKVSFSYAAPQNSLDKPYIWQDVWPKESDVEQIKKLPLAVKLKLTLAKKDKHQKEIDTTEIERIIPLPLAQ